MKKLLIAVAIIAFVACNKQEVESAVELETVRLTVPCPEMGTKVTSSIGSTQVTYSWSDGDVIGVRAEKDGTIYEFKLKSRSGASGDFEGELPKGTESVYVYYPKDLKIIESTIASQNYNATNFDQQALFFWTGMSPAPINNIELKPAYAGCWLKIKTSRSTDLPIGKIVFKGNGHTVTMYTEGVSLNANAKDFYIVVPTGNYPFRLEVFSSTDGETPIQTFTKVSGVEFTGYLAGMQAITVD